MASERAWGNDDAFDRAARGWKRAGTERYVYSSGARVWVTDARGTAEAEAASRLEALPLAIAKLELLPVLPTRRCSGCGRYCDPSKVCPNRPDDDDPRMQDLYDDSPQHEGDV